MYVLINKPGVNFKIVLCFSVLASISIVSLVIQCRNRINVEAQILVVNNELTNNISCHYETGNNALPSFEDIEPQSDSIYFHETSCIGGLDSRKACAVESAARLHPNRSVYVFFNSPISERVLNMSCLSILSQLKNVKFARIYSDRFAKGTELMEMLSLGSNTGSAWPVQHTADMLRFITLYKYGGIYLDTDMIVVKPLDALGENWAARETDKIINIAAMAFSKKGVGRRLAKTIIRDIMKRYRPDLWDYNGSGALKRSLRQICRTKIVARMSAALCRGFQIYEPITVYPLHWSISSYYFMKYHERPEEIINREDEIYAHHLWNKLSVKYKVEIDSPFERIARKYCPSVRSAFGDQFGT